MPLRLPSESAGKGSGGSLYGIPECSGIVADTGITGDNRYEGRWFTESSRGGQVDCVQRTNRFDRERARRPVKDRFRDAHEVRTAAKPLSAKQRSSLLLCGDYSRKPCAKNGSGGFGKGKDRCKALTWSTNRGSRGRIAFE
jgi:hypothetical protein